MFLKKKRDRKIKGRGCVDGRPQHLDPNKPKTSASTVASESVLLTSVIDVMENRDVATVDIPGAFLHADMEGDDVHMKLEGMLVEMLARIDPKLYCKYIRDENGKTVMYVQLKKALYGTIQVALLFWKNLTASLQEWGFTINPYDWCVANKMVNGEQLTVIWYVDDLKISHADPEAVTQFMKKTKRPIWKRSAPNHTT